MDTTGLNRSQDEVAEVKVEVEEIPIARPVITSVRSLASSECNLCRKLDGKRHLVPRDDMTLHAQLHLNQRSRFYGRNDSSVEMEVEDGRWKSMEAEDVFRSCFPDRSDTASAMKNVRRCDMDPPISWHKSRIDHVPVSPYDRSEKPQLPMDSYAERRKCEDIVQEVYQRAFFCTEKGLWCELCHGRVKILSTDSIMEHVTSNHVFSQKFLTGFQPIEEKRNTIVAGSLEIISERRVQFCVENPHYWPEVRAQLMKCFIDEDIGFGSSNAMNMIFGSSGSAVDSATVYGSRMKPMENVFGSGKSCASSFQSSGNKRKEWIHEEDTNEAGMVGRTCQRINSYQMDISPQDQSRGSCNRPEEATAASTKRQKSGTNYGEGKNGDSTTGQTSSCTATTDRPKSVDTDTDDEVVCLGSFRPAPPINAQVKSEVVSPNAVQAAQCFQKETTATVNVQSGAIHVTKNQNTKTQAAVAPAATCHSGHDSTIPNTAGTDGEIRKELPLTTSKQKPGMAKGGSTTEKGKQKEKRKQFPANNNGEVARWQPSVTIGTVPHGGRGATISTTAASRAPAATQIASTVSAPKQSTGKEGGNKPPKKRQLPMDEIFAINGTQFRCTICRGIFSDQFEASGHAQKVHDLVPTPLTGKRSTHPSKNTADKQPDTERRKNESSCSWAQTRTTQITEAQRMNPKQARGGRRRGSRRR